MSNNSNGSTSGNGWVKIHRNIMKWEWYSDHNTTRLFLHLLFKANHSDNEWKGIKIKAGSLVTGRKVLASETGLSEQQIRSSLTKLKSTQEVTIKPTNKFSIITLCNWGYYQTDEEKVTNKTANEQPTNNQQITTNKKDKKEKKDKKYSNRAEERAFNAENQSSEAVKFKAIAIAKKAVGDAECPPAVKIMLVEWAEFKIHTGLPLNALSLRKIFTEYKDKPDVLRTAVTNSISCNYKSLVVPKEREFSQATKVQTKRERIRTL